MNNSGKNKTVENTFGNANNVHFRQRKSAECYNVNVVIWLFKNLSTYIINNLYVMVNDLYDFIPLL